MTISHATVMYYPSESRWIGWIPDEVMDWFLSDYGPIPHGSIRVRDRWGDVYQIGKLVHDLDPRWSDAVRAWLTGLIAVPETLLVVWTVHMAEEAIC